MQNQLLLDTQVKNALLCGMKFSRESNFREFFIDPRKLNLLLFTLLNFDEIGCKQCNKNDHKLWLPFLLLLSTVHEIPPKFIPKSKV